MRGIPRATNVNSGRGRDPSERPLSDSRRAWRAMCTVACGPHSSKKGSMLRQPLFGRSTVLKPAQRGAMVDPSSRLGDRSHSGIGNVRACARFGRQSGGILPGCASVPASASLRDFPTSRQGCTAGPTYGCERLLDEPQHLSDPPDGAKIWRLVLAIIGQAAAVATGEDPARRIQENNPAAAVPAIGVRLTLKPRSASAKCARRPLDQDALRYDRSVLSWPTP
jgi:hypothetical protein